MNSASAPLGSTPAPQPASGQAAASDLEVLRADLAVDREAILNLWIENFPDVPPADHARRFAWFYLDNPMGPGRCWLLRQRSTGMIVGTAGLGLRRFHAGKDTLLGGLASDFAVAKQHRTALPALLLQRAVLDQLKDDLALIYTFPNARSMPIFKRVGYRMIGAPQRWVKVLRVKDYLAKRAAVGWAAPVLGPVLDAARAALSTETWRSANGWKLRPVQSIDDRVNPLVERGLGNLSIYSDRSPQYLDWRYLRDPLRRFQVFQLESADGQLHGLAVGLLRADGEFRIIDLVADPQQAALPILLLLVVRAARQVGARTVAVEGSNLEWLEPELRKLHFKARQPNLTCMAMVRAGGPDLSNWRVLLADEDYN